MYCPKCGTENADDSTYCKKCGASLAAVSGPSQAPPAAPSAPTPSGVRSPLLAAVLNLFFGLGYVYLGYNRVLGLQTVIFVVVMIVVYFLLGLFTVGILSLVLAILLAVDGYQKGTGQKGFVTVS